MSGIKMGTRRLFTIGLIVILFVLYELTTAQCPPGCSCKSVTAVICNPGFNGFPFLLTHNTKLLSLSGSYKTHNKIETLKKSYFMPVPALQTLRMSHCELVTIANDTFSSLVRLQHLDLSYNNIPRITDRTFLGLTNLISLKISGNPNCEVNEKSFDNLMKLQEIYTAEISLECLIPDMYTNMKDLRILDIHGNNVWKLDIDLGNIFPSLQYLDLSGNQLKGIPKTYNQSFVRLHSVKLYGNPLQCNCELRWLKSTKAAFDSEYPSEALSCSGPERLKFAPIHSVPYLEFNCIRPSIRCASDTYIVMETEPLKMVCELGGDPFPDVTWTRDDGHLDQFTYNTSKYHVSRKGSLDILNVSKADEGIWTITANSSVGQVTHALKVTITKLASTTTTTTTITTTTKKPPTLTTSTSQRTSPTTTITFNLTSIGATNTNWTSLLKLENVSDTGAEEKNNTDITTRLISTSRTTRENHNINDNENETVKGNDKDNDVKEQKKDARQWMKIFKSDNWSRMRRSFFFSSLLVPLYSVPREERYQWS